MICWTIVSSLVIPAALYSFLARVSQAIFDFPDFIQLFAALDADTPAAVSTDDSVIIFVSSFASSLSIFLSYSKSSTASLKLGFPTSSLAKIIWFLASLASFVSAWRAVLKASGLAPIICCITWIIFSDSSPKPFSSSFSNSSMPESKCISSISWYNSCMCWSRRANSVWRPSISNLWILSSSVSLGSIKICINRSLSAFVSSENACCDAFWSNPDK